MDDFISCLHDAGCGKNGKIERMVDHDDTKRKKL